MDSEIASLDRQFSKLYSGWREIIDALSAHPLDSRSSEIDAESVACGEQVVRSARIVEQAFGGITANLWDDPFEWTLPETLRTPEQVLDYLNEVERTRRRAFETFQNDRDLSKEIMTPGGLKQLRPFLLDTLERARHHQQRAANTLEHVLTTDH